MATTSADSPAEDSPPLRDQNGEQQEGKAEEESQGPSAAQPEEPPSENEVVKMEAVTPDVGQEAEEADEKPSVEIVAAEALAAQDRAEGTESGGGIVQFAREDGRPKQASPRGCGDSGDGTVKEVKQEQRDENESPMNNCIEGKACDDAMEKNNGDSELENKRRASVEISSSDGEPLSRMDSEDSISSTLMDMDSTVSSGRSTPAMMNGLGSAALSSNKSVAYTCCWDQCLACFSSSPDLAEHIRTLHVDGQRGGVFVCLWKGCKVYNTPSTSQSWLQRHMLTHSGDKPFKCVVGGCYASFASQGGLARHVPTHFSQQSSSKLSNQARLKEDSPSKAGLSKRRKLRNKRRRSLPRPHDFFDAQTMDTIRHRAICLNMATHIESRGGGHSVVFHSTVMARRKEDSGKVKVLLHWTPEDILPDVWVNETDRVQLKTKAVHLSQLPTDTAILLDPNIYRTLPQKRMKRR